MTKNKLFTKCLVGLLCFLCIFLNATIEIFSDTDTAIEDGLKEEPVIHTVNSSNPEKLIEMTQEDASTMTLFAQNELQELITNNTSGTIMVGMGKTYEGDITIDKAMTISGDGTGIIKGNVICTAAVTFDNVKIEGSVSVSSALEIKKSTVTGGVKIADSNSIVTINSSTLNYNNSTPAIIVTGTPINTNYTIGIDASMWNADKTLCNTFVNNGDGNAIAISWPVHSGPSDIDTKDKYDKVMNSRLVANGNYWKLGDEDALFNEVKVDGDIKYANELPMVMDGHYATTEAFLIVPPEGFVYKKRAPGFFKNYDEYVQVNDYALVLFGRSFNTNGTQPPIFTDYDLKSLLRNGKLYDLPNTYHLKGTGLSYKDSSYRTPYTVKEMREEVRGDGVLFYMSNYQFHSRIDIEPKNMVSYEGTTGQMSSGFPRVWYDYNAINLWFKANKIGPGDWDWNLDKLKPFKGFDKEYINFGNIITNINYIGDVSILKAYMKDKNTTYEPWNDVADLTLDPDGDFMPFAPGFHKDGESIASSTNQDGKYTIQVDNSDNIPRLEYDSSFDKNGLWPSSGITDSVGTVYNTDFTMFYTNFLVADLIVRPTSGNLSIEMVSDTLPLDSENPVAAINATAEYKDSSRQVINKNSVLFLNDREEPNKEVYTAMLNEAKTNSATESMNYAYHFLSLLNPSDGNNVITTAEEKTVYIPFPSDYKTGDKISLMHFDGYQRMPEDDIDKAIVSVISGKDITMMEKGFTFKTSGDMGAYILAYGTTRTTEPPVTPPETPPVTPPVTPEEPTKPDLPSEPGFEKPPYSGGEVIKGPDNLYYYVSDNKEPLAYYDEKTNSWISIENIVLTGLSATGILPWILVMSISGIVLFVATLLKLKKNK